mgnify:CR=1 FL=1|jgi:hypothetical protein
MRAASTKLMTGLMVASVVCLLAMDFAEARRGGGGGRGHSMSRGGPAASGSFNRSRARPSGGSSMSSRDRSTNRNVNRDMNRATNRDVNRDVKRDTDRQVDQDRLDQRQDNRQDRFDQRQDNIDQRQDFRKDAYDDRKEYYDNRNEWYEDRWRAGAYLSVSSWNRMNCSYTTVRVDSITYYDCNGVRYERVYRGTSVTYIVVN